MSYTECVDLHCGVITLVLTQRWNTVLQAELWLHISIAVSVIVSQHSDNDAGMFLSCFTVKF
jgi:hypothetical protein